VILSRGAAGRDRQRVKLSWRQARSPARPRVRADSHEVLLPTFHAMADLGLLNRHVVERMLVCAATRRDALSSVLVPGHDGEPWHAKSAQTTIETVVREAAQPPPCGSSAARPGRRPSNSKRPGDACGIRRAESTQLLFAVGLCLPTGGGLHRIR
jgi:hypothetical protein